MSGNIVKTVVLGAAVAATAGAALPAAVGLPSLGTAGLLGIAGTTMTAVGQFQASQAADANAKHNAAIEQANAQNRLRDAELAKLSADEQAESIRRETRRRVGSAIAKQTKSGVITSEGSPLLVQEEVFSEGELDAQKTLYSGGLRAASFTQDSEIAKMRASSANSQVTGTGVNVLTSGTSILTGTSRILG